MLLICYMIHHVFISVNKIISCNQRTGDYSIPYMSSAFRIYVTKVDTK